MKRVLFLLVVFSFVVSAQTKDSIDIRAIVQKQIDAAIERDRLEQIKRDSLLNVKVYFGPELPLVTEKLVYFGPEPEYFGPKEEVLPAAMAFAVNDSIAKADLERKNREAAQKIISAPVIAKKQSNDSSGWQFYFLGAISIFAFSFVFIRRMILNRSNKAGKTLKNNIRILRGENLIKREQPQLKSVRSSLLNSPVILNNHGKALSEVAKELNISQGEILLAAKIKSYELAKGNNSKWFLN